MVSRKECMLCLGVGIFWVVPYEEATKAHFYQNLLIASAADPTN